MARGKGVSTGTLLLSVLVVLVVAVGFIYYVMPKQPQAIQTTVLKTTTGETVSGVSCPDTGQTSFRVAALDANAQSTTYINAMQPYLIPISGPSATFVTVGTTSSSSPGYGTAVNINCDEAGNKWEIVLETKQDTATSAFKFVDSSGKELPKEDGKYVVVASGAAVDVVAYVERLKYPELRIWDNVDNVALQNDNASNSTTFETLSLGGTIEFENQNGYSSLTIDDGEELNLEFALQTNASRYVSGERGLRTYLCVDASTSYWDTPTVTMDGKVLNEVSKSEMTPEEAKKLADYEYCYDIGQITSSVKKINWRQGTVADPGSAQSPVFKIIPQGKFLGQQPSTSKKIMTGAYKDDVGTYTPVVFSGDGFEWKVLVS